VTTLEEQTETSLRPEASFAFVADFANAMHWDPGVATSERIDAGPVGVGARYRLGVRLGRRVAPMEYRITVFEPPRRVVLVGEGSGVSAVDEIHFRPIGTGTRIEYRADIRLGGLMRLVQPFLGRAFAALGRNALDGMRRALDGRAAAEAGRDPDAPAQPATPDPAATGARTGRAGS
jgi:carbon monoxide dehydrogenase subunit G